MPFLAIKALLTETPPNDFQNKYRVLRDSLVELVATMFFVAMTSLATASSKFVLLKQSDSVHMAAFLSQAIAVGAIVIGLTYTVGHISGGHFNPAITFVMFCQRRVSIKKMLCYWVCQCIGAILGSALLYGALHSLAGDIIGSTMITEYPFDLIPTMPEKNMTMANIFLLELIGGFFFYTVVSQASLDDRGIGKTALPAIPIGLALMAANIALLPFSGCSINPARSLGPAITLCMASGGGSPCKAAVGKWYWVYFIAPMVAAYLTAEVTFLLHWDVSKYDPEGQAVNQTIGEAGKSTESEVLQQLKSMSKEDRARMLDKAGGTDGENGDSSDVESQSSSSEKGTSDRKR